MLPKHSISRGKCNDLLPVRCVGILVVFLGCAHFAPLTYAYSDSPWTWSCSDGISCQRQLANGTEPQVSLNVCWLTCGAYGAMWPHPTVKVYKKICIFFVG